MVQTRKHLIPNQAPFVRHRHRRLWHVGSLSFDPHSRKQVSLSRMCSAKLFEFSGEPLKTLAGSCGYVAPEVLIRGTASGKPVDLRSDGLKELARQTSEARINFRLILEGRIRRRYGHMNIPATFSDNCSRTHTARDFIRALPNPDPTRRLKTEQALAHPWLTTFTSPTEHDLSGLRENFDPRARWRNAIGAARVLSRFSNENGAGANKDKLSISDDEDDADNGTTKTSLRATPNSKKSQ
jgi:calcium/calmodulin-dependent protein kinase I